MLKPFCFAKSVLYPSNFRAKPHALYVDPLNLNAVFQFETLFVFLISIVPAASQQRLDRIRIIRVDSGRILRFAFGPGTGPGVKNLGKTGPGSEVTFQFLQ